MRNTAAILTVCSVGFVAALVTAAAQQPRAASSGVYAQEQVARGDAIYKEQCAACHGDNLEGSGPMPPLAGIDFLSNWQGKTLGELYEKTQSTMPATAPGTLVPDQLADLLAYMLSVSRYPAGATALEGKMEALLPITLDAPLVQPASVAGSGGGAVVARGASSGVYVEEQVARGDVIYKEQCAACHGDNLEGSGPMPPLAGIDFLTNWRGKTLGDLYEKTQSTMPATAPGTLTPEQTADLLAYILKASRYPAGTVALEGRVEALLPITLDTPGQ